MGTNVSVFIPVYNDELASDVPEITFEEFDPAKPSVRYGWLVFRGVKFEANYNWDAKDHQYYTSIITLRLHTFPMWGELVKKLREVYGKDFSYQFID